MIFNFSKRKQLTQQVKSFLDSEDVEGYLFFVKENYEDLNRLGILQNISRPSYNPNSKKWERTFDNYASKALETRKEKDIEKEKKFLHKAINHGINLPIYFKRLAIIYTKEKAFGSATKVCMKYFELQLWTDLSYVDESLNLIKRMQKLNEKIKHT